MVEVKIDEIIAATSSALSKREEFKKLLEETSKIKEELKRNKEKEAIENLLDKGYIIATRLTGVGKHIEALDLLAFMIPIGRKNDLREVTTKLTDKYYQICSNAIKEAKNWGQLDLAMLISFLVDAIESLNITPPPEDLRKMILELETNPDVNPILLDLKRDLNNLLINPSEDIIEEFTKKYEKLFKERGLEKELGILINIVKHMIA